MCSQSGIKAIAVALMLGTMLAGCSEIYFDRRDTVSLGAGDSIATNKAVHTIDPWPRHSTRTHIAFNGERMQLGTERYKHNRSIPPVNVTTSSAAYQKVQQDAAAASAATQQAGSASAAAPVKGAGSP